MMKTKIVGLDLSITATGIASVTGKCYTVGGNSKLGDKRLSVIEKSLQKHLKADVYMIEDLPINAHGSGITGMVHGVTRNLLLQYNKPYVLIPPASLKKYATGKGNANKLDMADSLYKHFGLQLADDNQVDAYWLRLMGLDYFNVKKIDLPEDHKIAMKKIKWCSL